MKKFGVALSVLGGFLVGIALLALVYMPGQLKKTPLDVDTTTHLAGQATLGTDTFPVKTRSLTRTDSEASDGEVAVFVNSVCVVRNEDAGTPACVSADDPENRLLSASVDNFATDRKTARAVNDPEYLPADAEEHEGLVNKWPFDAEKKDYPYWDGTAGSAQNARFDGVETIKGLETYRYVVEVGPVPLELTDGVQGTYETTKTIWVEPNTGSVVNQSEAQKRTTDEGDNFLTLDVAFTDEQISDSVEEAEGGASRLNLITRTVPIVGLVVGIPMLIAGIVLTLRRTSRREEDVDRVPAHVG